MNIFDIKIERSLSLTGPQWDALIISCYLALNSIDILCRQYPTAYAKLQSDVSSCYSSLLALCFGDEVLASSGQKGL